MKLSGNQYKQLTDALIDGFNLSALERMLRSELDERLDEIASGRTSLTEVVSETIAWAERIDRVDDLIAGAKSANPHNQKIKALPDSFEANASATTEQSVVATNAGMGKVHTQRLRDLEKHLADDTDLLNQYEEQLRDEDDPRRLRRIQREIDRQKESIARYSTQYDALIGDGSVTTSSESDAAIKAVGDQISGMQQQISAMEMRLTAQHNQTRTQMSVQQETILAQIDASQRETVAIVTAKLDQQQLETVELLYDIVDQQQIAQWEAENTANMVRHALVDLSQLPDAGYWQQLLDAVDSDSAWEQKLKLTIPIIPTILEFETEVALDLMPALREKWQQLMTQIKR